MCDIRFTHKSVNHSLKYGFVDPHDKDNHINSIESHNRYLKKEMISRRNETLVDQYMALRYYRLHFLNPLPTFGAKVHKFLSDVSKVCPGPESEGMQLQLIENPTAEEMRISHLMPHKRKRNIRHEDNEQSDLKDNDESWNED